VRVLNEMKLLSFFSVIRTTTTNFPRPTLDTPESCKDSLYLAELAEQAERHEEMVENTKRVTSSEQELVVRERNLLSVAYKFLHHTPFIWTLSFRIPFQ
jgi:hypothetical protein